MDWMNLFPVKSEKGDQISIIPFSAQHRHLIDHNVPDLGRIQRDVAGSDVITSRKSFFYFVQSPTCIFQRTVSRTLHTVAACPLSAAAQPSAAGLQSVPCCSNIPKSTAMISFYFHYMLSAAAYLCNSSKWIYVKSEIILMKPERSCIR